MPRQTQAILAGHVDVDQREVDGMRSDDRLRGAGAFGADCRVAMRDEVFLQHLAHVRLVIDNQDRGFRDHGRGSPPSGLAGANDCARGGWNRESYN